MQKTQQSGWRAFLRLWFVLAFAYVLLKFTFNLTVMGWVDLRRSFLLEVLLMPFGQSLVLWVITHRTRRPTEPA